MKGLTLLLLLFSFAVIKTAHTNEPRKKTKREINRSPPTLAKPTAEPTGPNAELYKALLERSTEKR